MGLNDTLTKASTSLQQRKIAFALIGGFALAAHGVVRATQDIDLLIDGNRQADAIKALEQAGFKIVHQTPEVCHFSGPGQLDVLWANREPTQRMIQKSVSIQQFPVNVVQIEDLIGLKIQAYKNDSRREFQDKADILSLLERHKDRVDLQKVYDYADIFGERLTIQDLLKRI
jgi:predicted nucleotidyltransferase